MRRLFFHRRQIHHGQRGLTMIELAIVLAVAGLLIGGVWAAASAANEARRVNETVDQVRHIVENIRARYSTSQQLPNESYGVFTQTAASADMFPAETWLNPGIDPAACNAGSPCYFVNPWDGDGSGAVCGGGTICLSANDLFNGVVARFSFALQLRNLPQAACIKVGSALADIASDVGLVAVGTDVADNAAPANAAVVPTVAWLTANCDGANPNHLYLAFRVSP